MSNMDLTDCELKKWYNVVRIDTESMKTKLRLGHLGLTGKVKVKKRKTNGPVIVKVKACAKSNPLILSHKLATKIIVEEKKKNFDGNMVGKRV